MVSGKLVNFLEEAVPLRTEKLNVFTKFSKTSNCNH
ncbi:MAG: hypothetical protein [Phormidium phage MIS-PhV1A]|nr:MAG: hypothetical protein AV945_gp51 [Phormidium phage MIS-PhV1A]AGZ61796.1 MAG: hypothetical protein [Phormidium phage MIS-PhV1A]